MPAAARRIAERRHAPSVADGPHTFSLVVTDAAGNSQIVNSPSVVVDNDGPPPPALTATAKGGGSNVIALAWRNPAARPRRSPAQRAAVPDLVSAGDRRRDGRGADHRARPGLYTVRLWLLDAHGQGGPHNAALATVTAGTAKA